VHQVQLYVECGSLGVQSFLVLCKINDGTQPKRRKEMIGAEVRQAKETEVRGGGWEKRGFHDVEE